MMKLVSEETLLGALADPEGVLLPGEEV